MFLIDYIFIYYIDKSVFVENRPLVKSIRNYIRDSSGVFSISSKVRISMTLLLVQKHNLEIRLLPTGAFTGSPSA